MRCAKIRMAAAHRCRSLRMSVFGQKCDSSEVESLKISFPKSIKTQNGKLVPPLVIATGEKRTEIRAPAAPPQNGRFRPKCDSSEVAILKISYAKIAQSENRNLETLVITLCGNKTEIHPPSAPRQYGRFGQNVTRWHWGF